ncbi:MBL fold metallo-hydrolase [Algoriphagus sp. AGSA1]|uniref:MBL fold metallo-hydrolase RNA specificity domain-containing protein n=1 Tax=Algoriphagus sp. AGSA1 TaxID=2907213 RepID=UPI001F33EABF|nr:MBL fold metallo-hydrolase [Algoriphagus sp. AGSA1]MCE7057322.1 MBL fold metallo-hydrolase [Algoriphagus sp. AGSA1]
MDVRVKFLGAAGSVTGSRYLLDLGDFEFLIDCGLFQGKKELRRRNWDKFPMAPQDIEAVVLTHAHMDHIGYLPKLVKDGFSGPIYCTAATAEIAKILLLDAGKLQEEEAEYAKKKGYSRHENPEPLYTVEDAEAVFPLFQPQEFKTPFAIHPSVEVTYYHAGHILGAAITKVVIKGELQTKKLVFSGDLGRHHDPLLYPPTLIPGADVVWIESTYGDRISPTVKPEEELASAINDIFSRDGLAIIPAFAVGRTQLVMYYLYQLIKKGKIPNVPIYLDSPMAINVSQLYREFHQDHQLIAVLEDTDQHPFQHSGLHYVRKQEQSRMLNDLQEKAIIISASGMATGGRVLHHLMHHLPNERNGVVFVGYQAEGTRGRRIVNGESEIRIFGQEVPVKAKVYNVEGLSAHADQNELIEWAEGFTEKPKLAFMIHGEEKSSSVLAEKLKKELGWNTVIPNYLESFMLFEGI